MVWLFLSFQPSKGWYLADQLNNLGRIVAFYKWDELSSFQNGTNWRLGRIVAYWNLGRIVAWDELSLGTNCRPTECSEVNNLSSQWKIILQVYETDSTQYLNYSQLRKNSKFLIFLFEIELSSKNNLKFKNDPTTRKTNICYYSSPHAKTQTVHTKRAMKKLQEVAENRQHVNLVLIYSRVQKTARINPCMVCTRATLKVVENHCRINPFPCFFKIIYFFNYNNNYNIIYYYYKKI